MRKILAAVLITCALLTTGIVTLVDRVYAQRCPVTCPDVGCYGGSVYCAEFECRGVYIRCYTTPK